MNTGATGGDVRQVRSAAKGIVHHRDVAGAELERLPVTARTDSGIAPRCTGM